MPDPLTRLPAAPDPFFDDPVLQAALEQYRHEHRRKYAEMARTLLAAGWSFELPASHDPGVMSWYWRRPPRRKGSKGMKFLSTDRALNALRKEQGECPTP